VSHAAAAPAMHPETATGLDSRKLAIWTFIGSECLFFASLISTYLVYKGKNLIGIVTDTDIVRRAVATSKPLGRLTVEKIMTTPICTIEGSQAVDDAQDMMSDLGVRHLAVTQAGEIVGVVSVRDVLMFYKRYAQSKIPLEAPYSEPKIFQD